MINTNMGKRCVEGIPVGDAGAREEVDGRSDWLLTRALAPSPEPAGRIERPQFGASSPALQLPGRWAR
jgi:hypothetical protein